MSEAWSLTVLALLAYAFWRIGRPDKKKEDK
jgi:hypothetical protein